MITVYSQPNCAGCTQTKRRMDKKNIPYTDVNVSEDAEARKFVTSLEFKQTPVVVVRDEAGELVDSWSGFRVDKIDAMA